MRIPEFSIDRMILVSSYAMAGLFALGGVAMGYDVGRVTVMGLTGGGLALVLGGIPLAIYEIGKRKIR
jgi:hypothetical protein